MPTIDKLVATLPIAATAKNSYVLVDITDLVKGWQGGLSNLGIALSPNAAMPVYILIGSKEGVASSHSMEIEVSLEGLPGAKGDKGDTGATGPQGLQGPVGPIGISGYEVVHKRVFVRELDGLYVAHVPCPNNKMPLSATVMNIRGNNRGEAIAHGPDNLVDIFFPKDKGSIAYGWVFYIKTYEVFYQEYELEVTCVTANIPNFINVTP